jgi:SnoaL-like domain
MNRTIVRQTTTAGLPCVISRRSGGRGILALAIGAALALAPCARAGTEENPEDFMQMHSVEIAFHEAGSTKNLELMLSLFADEAVLIAKGKTYIGKEQIKGYWQAHPAFQPKNQWVGYTPAFRIHYSVQGDSAHLYFECLWVDAIANKIATHTDSDDTLVRVNGKWLIKQMKAAVVPGV